MDWPKIKNILIGVLIVSNLLLGFTFYRDRLRFETENTDNLQGVIQLFASKNISLPMEKDAFPKQMRSMNVLFEKYGLRNIDGILNGDYIFDGEKYLTDTHVLVVSDTGLFYADKKWLSKILESNEKAYAPIVDPVDISGLKVNVDTFLSNLGLEKHYDSINAYEIDGYTVVKLYQYFDGYMIEESKTTVWFLNGQGIGLERENATNIIDTLGTYYDIISLDRVLYSLLPKLTVGIPIKDISIVYKLNDDSLLVSDLIEGEALPYYQVTMGDGVIFHLRAIKND